MMSKLQKFLNITKNVLMSEQLRLHMQPKTRNNVGVAQLIDYNSYFDFLSLSLLTYNLTVAVVTLNTVCSITTILLKIMVCFGHLCKTTSTCTSLYRLLLVTTKQLQGLLFFSMCWLK